MSFQALNSALSGLRIAQQQLSVISNNVANVGTPGYTRKILPQSTQVLNSTGQIIGVQPETIIRNVDLNLSRDLWTQVSAVSALDVKGTYLGAIEKFHGPPDKELSVAAEIARLRDAFSALADAPDDGFLLQATLDQAEDVASKFNDFSNLINQQRNDAQGEMSVSVERANDLLEQIAEMNVQIKGAGNLGRSTAAMEDQRDEAIKQLANEIEISLFKRGDGVIVIQTRTGVQLADETAQELFFSPGQLGPDTFYPSGAAGVYVGGNPATNLSAFDITNTGVGGRLGGLIELRDDIMPQYQAQIDEMAHKLALRFEAQGLRLFTDDSGLVPADTPPNPTLGTPVPYVGFAGSIQVNPDVVANINLIQQGTYTSDETIPTGSNVVIRRVLEHTFGTVDYQEAVGTTDLNVALPATDLQQWLGIFSQNTVTAGINIGSFPVLDDANPATTTDLSGALSNYFPNWPADDQFQITFQESRTGLGPTTVTIDLSAANTNFPIGPGVNDALDQIISEINSQITLAGVPAGLSASATRNTNGQLVIESRGNITLDATFAGSMGTSAFSALGFSENTYTTEDPYFDIQVGNNAPVRVTIEPGDTTADLVNKLEWDVGTQTGVRGLYVDLDAGTGRLTIRPGIDDSNGGRVYGGDIRLIGGPFETSGSVNPALAALPDSVGIVSALFGSYTVSGPTVTERSAIVDVPYRSEISTASGTYTGLRSRYLGPGVNKDTGILTATSILDYAQKVVNKQTQDITVNDTRQADETTLHDLLQRQLLDTSGVNIDEELSNLIVVQTAYAAAARAVTAADELFRELLDSIR